MLGQGRASTPSRAMTDPWTAVIITPERSP
jgi:hypothetical protein